MSRLPRPLLLAIVLMAAVTVAVSAVGCKKKTPTAPAIIDIPTATVAATSTATATKAPIVATGPITSPVSGTAQFTALLDAARKKFATTSQFRVYQVFVQGDTALGEIEQITGGTGRIYAAWTGPEWMLMWSAPVGGAGATKANVTAALPTFSAEMLAKFTWTAVAAVAQTPAAQTQTASQTASTDEATMKKSLGDASLVWANTAMSGAGKPYQLLVCNVAKDASGTWWGVVYIQPTNDSSHTYPGLEYWCKYEGGKWTSKLLGTAPPSPSSYYPAAIIEALQI